jgi:iron complex transport system permease protein
MLVLPGLLVVLVVAAAVAATIGAAGIPLDRIVAAFGLASGDPALVERDWLVLWSIRLPRIALAIVVGATRSPIPRWSAYRAARRSAPPQ